MTTIPDRGTNQSPHHPLFVILPHYEIVQSPSPVINLAQHSLAEALKNPAIKEKMLFGFNTPIPVLISLEAIDLLQKVSEVL